MVNLRLPAASRGVATTIALGRGLHTSGWEKRGSQDLSTALAVAASPSAVRRGGEEVRIDRLRRPAAHSSRRLRLVQQSLLYSPRSPYALCLLLYSTIIIIKSLLPGALLAPVLASLCPAPLFLADMCTHSQCFLTISEHTTLRQAAVVLNLGG